MDRMFQEKLVMNSCQGWHRQLKLNLYLIKMFWPTNEFMGKNSCMENLKWVSGEYNFSLEQELELDQTIL